MGAQDSPEQCARTHAVCMRLVERLRARGVLTDGSAFKNARKRKEPHADSLVGLSAASLQFDGDDAALQLHANSRADSGCQGVYHNPHINMYGVVSPGQAAAYDCHVTVM